MQTMLQELLNFLSIEITVLLTAALPIIELRGAIPVGISLGLSPIHATLISLLGSMIPVPFILFSIRPIFNYLKTTKMFKKLVHSITDRSMNGRSFFRDELFQGRDFSGQAFKRGLFFNSSHYA